MKSIDCEKWKKKYDDASKVMIKGLSHNNEEIRHCETFSLSLFKSKLQSIY